MDVKREIKHFFQKTLYPLLFLLTIPCLSNPMDQKLTRRVLDGKIELFYFYRDAMNIIKQTAALEEFDKRAYFYEALFKTFPSQAFEWLKEAQIKLEEHDALIYALWRGGSKFEAMAAAQRAGWPTKNVMDLINDPKPALELSPEKTNYLNCLYCYFVVTGNPIYIGKIIDILGLTADKLPASFNLEELKRRTKQELISLMYHHEIAYQVCMSEAQTRSGEARRLLNEIIENHRDFLRKASLPERNGLLNGDILITDSPTFEAEWENLPLDSGPIGTAITTIPYPKETKQIKIIPLFSGFALDHELKGYVTYDIDIYDPAGEKIGSRKGKLGLQRQIPSRFLVQAADDKIALDFEVVRSKLEASDGNILPKPGVYKIQGIIKDHIGNNELKITRTLEISLPEDLSQNVSVKF